MMVVECCHAILGLSSIHFNLEYTTGLELGVE
jgi:hypothetical protein